MRGTVVACLQSSPVAFQQRAAFVNPLDGQNLNRTFPGDAAGGPTARLAAWLFDNLITRSDYYIDCHCGDLPEVLDSFAGISPGPDGAFSEKARALADCFDVSRVILDYLRGSTLYQAAQAGVPAALVEIGGLGRWTQAEADVQRQGLHRAAAVAGIVPADGQARPRPPLFEEGSKVRCERGGLWFPVGSLVAEGTRLGRLEDPFGDEVQDVLAPEAGVLTYGLGSLAAGPGDLLASLSHPAPAS
jgi:predicted deacylase